jgi:hypothetical protein
MHAASADEDADGTIQLTTRCDRCGRNEDELNQP